MQGMWIIFPWFEKAQNNIRELVLKAIIIYNTWTLMKCIHFRGLFIHLFITLTMFCSNIESVISNKYFADGLLNTHLTYIDKFRIENDV